MLCLLLLPRVVGNFVIIKAFLMFACVSFTSWRDLHLTISFSRLLHMFYIVLLGRMRLFSDHIVNGTVQSVVAVGSLIVFTSDIG